MRFNNDLEFGSGCSQIHLGGGSGADIAMDLHYRFKQLKPSEKWLVRHNLGKYPAVAIADSAGNTVYGDVKYIDKNTVEITFSAAFSGTAFFN